jgi:hypothetical protein
MNASTESGQARKSWWLRDPTSQGYHREDSQSRLMGDNDHDDNSSREDEHAYPPTPSAGSSVAQLDAQNKASVIEAALKESENNTTQGQSVSDVRKETAEGIVTKPEESSEDPDEEDDAWDN